MILVYDTETTGLPDFKKQATDPDQPHIVQLGAVLYDERRKVVSEINLLIKPDDWVISPETTAIHGITQERAIKYGLKLATAIRLFLAFCDRAELLVAHNYDFDEKMVRRELHHIGDSPAAEAFRSRANHCTMKQATPICKLPSARGGYKWPKLQEVHQHLFGTGFEDAHDAMADVRACARVYFELNPLPGSAPTQREIITPESPAESAPQAPMEVD